MMEMNSNPIMGKVKTNFYLSHDCSDGFVLCDHEANKKDWVPLQNGIAKLHPFCRNCGTVKNVSSDKGRKIGYFVIALSKLKKILKDRGYRISEAQIRLIVKELTQIDGFEDTWWITFSKQKEIFTSTVRKYVKVSENVIEAVL